MKTMLACCLFVGSVLGSTSEFKLPEDISHAIATASVGENGGFAVRSMDEDIFFDYIKENWRSIIENIDQLPHAEPGPGRSVSEKDAIRAGFRRFATACEVLPPMEYVDFLDQFIALHENGTIDFETLMRSIGGPYWKKDSFLAVNWYHPRVEKILARLIKLTPPEEEAYLDSLKAKASGELADNYMTNKSDDAPLPETLPGVKLERPWGSLIRKYERLTGKKVNDGWEETERAARRTAAGSDPGSPGDTSQRLTTVWHWLAAALAAFLLAWSLWKLKWRRTA